MIKGDSFSEVCPDLCNGVRRKSLLVLSEFLSHENDDCSDFLIAEVGLRQHHRVELLAVSEADSLAAGQDEAGEVLRGLRQHGRAPQIRCRGTSFPIVVALGATLLIEKLALSKLIGEVRGGFCAAFRGAGAKPRQNRPQTYENHSHAIDYLQVRQNFEAFFPFLGGTRNGFGGLARRW